MTHPTSPMLKCLTALLAMSACLFPDRIQAGEIPVPMFYVKGDVIQNGEVVASVPEGEHGVIEGTVTSDGEALEFDGTGGGVTFDFDAGGLFGNPFTISAMVETIEANGYGSILHSAQPLGFGVRTMASHGRYSISGGGGGSWNVVTSPVGSLHKGALQHVAVTCDGMEVVIYVDGFETARGELPDYPKANQKIVLGDLGRLSEETGEVVDVPHSRLSHVAVFGSILTPEQISMLANGTEIPLK